MIRSLTSQPSYAEEIQAGSKRLLSASPLRVELARFGKGSEIIKGNVVSHSLIAAHLLNIVHMFKPTYYSQESYFVKKTR